MRVCFLDVATKTGWAFSDGGEPSHGVLQFDKSSGEELAWLLVDAEEKLSALLGRLKPELIGFESPILPATTNITTTRKLYCLAGKVEEMALRRRIRCVEASSSEIRRHFLGRSAPRRSKKAKAAVMARCKMLGWNPIDHNSGDALAGLDYLLALERPSHALRTTALFGSLR